MTDRPTLPPEQLELLYERIRRYVEHEDNLFNQRMSWFITINSFLFATVGLLFQSFTAAVAVSDESVRGALLTGIVALVATVSLVAILVCLFTARVLDHARHSMKRLGDIWEVNTRGLEVPTFAPRWQTKALGWKSKDKQPVAGVYPFVMGAGFVPFRRGVLRSSRVAFIFLTAWLVVAAILLLSLTRMLNL